MIYFRGEGDWVKQGLNLYRFSDQYNAGGILRIGAVYLRVRWSKKRRRLHYGIHRAA